MVSIGINTDDIVVGQALKTLRSRLPNSVLDETALEFYEETLEAMVGHATKWLNPDTVTTETLYEYAMTGVAISAQVAPKIAVEVKERICELPAGPLRMMAMTTLLTTLSKTLCQKDVVKVLEGSKGSSINPAVMSAYVCNFDMITSIFHKIQAGVLPQTMMPANIRYLIAAGFKDLDTEDKVSLLKSIGPLGKRKAKCLVQPRKKKHAASRGSFMNAFVQTESDYVQTFIDGIDQRIISPALMGNVDSFIRFMNDLSAREDMNRLYEFVNAV